MCSMEAEHDAEKIIQDMGGNGAVAELCNITSGAVSQWLSTGIPEYRMLFFRVKHPQLAERWPLQPSELRKNAA